MQVSIAHENEDYFLETETLKLLLKVILVTGCKWNCFLFSFFPAAKNQKLKVRTWLVGNAVNNAIRFSQLPNCMDFFHH